MSNLWERMKQVMKEDWERVQQKKEEVPFSEARPEQANLTSAEKQLREQKERVRMLRKKEDELDVQLAERTYEYQLAEEAEESDMMRYLERETEALRSQADKTKRVREEAEEQLKELDLLFQEMRHRQADQELELMELETKEKAADIRQQMKTWNRREETPVQEEPDMSSTAHMEERLRLLKQKKKEESASHTID
ncbi:hypothetical protein [Alkalicoccus urumqiensis]|uniref:PspA/IM30 family protein n=1 Tax=Alkalicoccus urumqiensis TaxID=1548213 RepID=A0A2P6MF90_ALKUR|nr:hypothetical protein [Alkalicoccus urumqiensis]PRO64911.1 hypothetical protein C6I21_12260 [Alkalicoccus urumqiensis]